MTWNYWHFHTSRRISFHTSISFIWWWMLSRESLNLRVFFIWDTMSCNWSTWIKSTSSLISLNTHSTASNSNTCSFRRAWSLTITWRWIKCNRATLINSLLFLFQIMYIFSQFTHILKLILTSILPVCTSGFAWFVFFVSLIYSTNFSLFRNNYISLCGISLSFKFLKSIQMKTLSSFLCLIF